jgi:hypothetical protein
MDQLKPYLLAIKKHHFWILLGILLITSGLVWYWSTTELDTKFTADKQKNESAFRQMMPIRSDMQTNSPPNPKFTEAVNKRTETLAGGVLDAWQRLFDKQMSVLSVNERVPEMVPYLIDPKMFQKEVPVNIRNVFQDNEVIDAEFHDLFAILDLRRPRGLNPVDEGNPAKQPQPGSPEGILLWNAKPLPRALMLRYKTVKTPSTARIRMLYEDLWVFRSMFKVIAKINERPIDVWLQIMEGASPPTDKAAVDQANVPIKQIDYCDLAQYAMSTAMNLPGNVQIGEEDGNSNSRPGANLAANAGTFSVGTQGNDEEDNKLRDGRYIDGRNQPVQDPAAPPFTEFKQIFVQMTVLMDQRLIPVLVAECANAELTIETRQVLVDLKDVDVLRGGAARAQDQNKVESTPHDVLVTVRGVVYGYSPPDKARLGQGSDPEPSKRDYGIPSKITQ